VARVPFIEVGRAWLLDNTNIGFSAQTSKMTARFNGTSFWFGEIPWFMLYPVFIIIIFCPMVMQNIVICFCIVN
jgi:hypothetical protein